MAQSFWLDGLADPRTAPLEGAHRADVVIVGGGYTGLWTALALLERQPSLDIVICEASTVGYGASGRNGGFCEASLTHGLANGVRHFPDEVRELEDLAEQNFAALQAFIAEHGIDCDFEQNGTIDLAVADWQMADLREGLELHQRFGQSAKLLDADAVQAHIRSPMVRGGLLRRESSAILHPGKLAVGLRRTAIGKGIAVHEGTPVLSMEEADGGVLATTPTGSVRAEHAVLATNAYSAGVLGSTRRHYVPVHDYVLVSEPLSSAQLDAIGWHGREGLADAGNQFHYFRLTADDRILWGGYDALYHYGNGVGPDHDEDPQVFRRLESHFGQMFPQLAELPFPYRWGGAIATTTRFTPVFGEALGGRCVYALGYTGLGVAATRFAGQVLADKICAPDSPLLRLRYTASTPFPFPPEPLRWMGVQMVRRAIARADRRQGRRGPLLKALDTLGIGFDS